MLLCDLRISPRSAVTKIANCNNYSKQGKTNILQYKEANMPKYPYNPSISTICNKYKSQITSNKGANRQKYKNAGHGILQENQSRNAVM